jgi:hypothetical protein
MKKTASLIAGTGKHQYRKPAVQSWVASNGWYAILRGATLQHVAAGGHIYNILCTSTMTAHASVAAAMTAHRPTPADASQYHHFFVATSSLAGRGEGARPHSDASRPVLQALAAAAVCAQASSPRNLGLALTASPDTSSSSLHYNTLHYMPHAREEWELHSGANERLIRGSSPVTIVSPVTLTHAAGLVEPCHRIINPCCFIIIIKLPNQAIASTPAACQAPAGL